jgi:hypothetical protein
MNNKNLNSNSTIGQYELIIKDIIDNKMHIDKANNMHLNYPGIINSSASDTTVPCIYTKEQNAKLEQLKNNISMIGNKIVTNDYNNQLMNNYIKWIDQVRLLLATKITNNTLYSFMKFSGKKYSLASMADYYDVPDTEKLFSFALFINNFENLTYLIGLVYNYAIMRKHFSEYKMRLYIDFHSVLGSPETFNVFNMFMDILEDIDPEFNETLQIVIFFLNPFYNVDNNNLFETMTTDIEEVKKYYTNIIFNSSPTYVKSPLLNMNVDYVSNTHNVANNATCEASPNSEDGINSKKSKVNISIDHENLEVNYSKINDIVHKTTFSLLACHIAVNLRFLPMNENCEFHVRDLDSRLSLTDKNIINKFNNPKYQYVPFYVFQFYKFYFPYLKWRIDVNPYLAGCFGGNNRKPVMISDELIKSNNLKILKRELFFKYILFISLNATNLQIGFLNDEFILANIFEKIKGKYSENILYLNLGSFTNKHVNDYYYGLSNNKNYPCILKLGVPIDILRYPLNGKYLTVDPITDFKMGNIPLKYHSIIKSLVTEQLKIYLDYSSQEKVKIANKIRKNYKQRLEDEINDDLESALFFSMLPKNYVMSGVSEFNKNEYTSKSFSNQFFSSVGASTYLVNNEKLKATNFMMAGYLLADVLEDIIFPTNPEFINSNYYLSEDNYDRLFNCLYFDEEKKSFVHRKINKDDLSRKYINQGIIEHIPDKFLEFKNKNDVIQSLNQEFNTYLLTCNYYPSMNYYLSGLRFNEFIQIGDNLLKSGTLIFIKNYTEPITDKSNNPIIQIENNNVKALKFNLDKEEDNVSGISIFQNKLRFNLILLDDSHINQMTYSNQNNKSKVNVKLVKSTHLSNLADHMRNNKFSDFLIVDKL